MQTQSGLTITRRGIKELFGVTKSTAAYFVTLEDFPRPVLSLIKRNIVYDRAMVIDWWNNRVKAAQIKTIIDIGKLHK